MDQLEEIKSKIDIVDLVGSYITLKKAGANYKANCPFHNEKSASFMVSGEKQIWHCFGCGEGGDAIGFTMKMEGLDFMSALKHLAEKTGTVLKDFKFDASDSKQVFFQINEIAARFYNHILLKEKAGAAALDYLKKRGLGQATIEKFSLGFAPDSMDLTKRFLIKKGYNITDILATGVVSKSDRGSTYDRFRERITIPINNVSGRTVGFSARILKDIKTVAKYVNTPENAVYHKGSILFGLDKAKSAIRAQDKVVLVEGNMDVITSHQVGVENVVASCGTAFTPEQAKLVKRFTNNLALCFDADSAGQQAQVRAIDIALSEELDVSIVQLKAGKDPDECIRAGVELWQQSIKDTIPVMDYYFGQATEGIDLSSLAGQRKAFATFLPQIAKLKDSISQSFWVEKLAQKIKKEPDLIWKELKKFKQPRAKVAPEKAKSTVPVTTINQKIEEVVLGLVLAFAETRGYIFGRLQKDDFTDNSLSGLYLKLKEYYDKHNDKSDIAAALSYEEKTVSDQLSLLASESVSPDEALEEAAGLVLRIKQMQTQVQRSELHLQIKEAEEAGNTALVYELISKLQKLL